jgi:uncharacterized protein
MLKTLASAFVGVVVVSTGAAAQLVSLATNPQGSLTYATGAGVATVAKEFGGVKMRVVPAGGPIVTLPMVNNGEAQFAISGSSGVGFASAGKSIFKGKQQKNLRVAATLFPLIVGYYVRKGSDIKSVADLKGKRVGVRFTKQKSLRLYAVASLAMYGMTFKDAVGVPVPSGNRQVADFMEGKIDAAIWSLSSGKTRQAHASVGGIRILSLPKTAAAQAVLAGIMPGVFIETIQPSKKFPGVDGPKNVLSSPLALTTSTKTSDEAVYQTIKAVFENKKKLVTIHRAFGSLNPKKMNVDIGVPYHRAAIKFFREKGM